LEGTVDDEIIGDWCWRMVTRVPARLHRTLTNLISCFQFFKGWVLQNCLCLLATYGFAKDTEKETGK